MPRIEFVPDQKTVEVDEKTKILLGARRLGIPIRFACASCRCGTCAVRILEGQENLSAMKDDEKKLLTRLELSLDGNVRLSCQARISGSGCKVDLSFQDEYDSDIGLDDGEDEA
ncbi:MAG: 2Fe-2S iron-sulfur cluster-binding protein [Bdellovibrionota bacterium]